MSLHFQNISRKKEETPRAVSASFYLLLVLCNDIHVYRWFCVE